MNCYLHPETPASAFCRSCGRPLCAVCQRLADGTVYCQDHVPGATYAGQPNPASGAPNPYFQAVPPQMVVPGAPSPALAFVLGWIPGVGAIYNGQYVKGLVHVVIFALIIGILNGDPSGASQAFLGIILGAFVIYMPFEAYHTARRRQMGQPMEAWSGLTEPTRPASRAPIGAILLIVIGVLFLLDTMHVLDFNQIGRFWPVILILVGAWMLYSRVTAGARVPPPPEAYPQPGTTTRPTNHSMETPHEQ